MKNVGMAGAIALVGIGLITIGLGRFDRESVAATSSDRSSRPTNSGRGSTCTTLIFRDEVTVVDTGCDFTFSTPELITQTKDVVPADLLGLGYQQTIKLPWRTGGQFTNFLPLLVFGRDFVTTLDFNPLTLNFGDWQGGISECVGLIDMDADGRLDLVLTQSRSGERRVGYLKNIVEIAPRIPADLNDDGRVNGKDMGLLLSDWTG